MKEVLSHASIRFLRVMLAMVVISTIWIIGCKIHHLAIRQNSATISDLHDNKPNWLNEQAPSQ